MKRILFRLFNGIRFFNLSMAACRLCGRNSVHFVLVECFYFSCFSHQPWFLCIGRVVLFNKTLPLKKKKKKKEWQNCWASLMWPQWRRLHKDLLEKGREIYRKAKVAISVIAFWVAAQECFLPFNSEVFLDFQWVAWQWVWRTIWEFYQNFNY